MHYQIVYPADMDDYDWMNTESKGWIEVTVRWAGAERAITFYDPIRLSQSVQGMLTSAGYFAEPAIVVVPNLTRDAIESTLAAIAQHDFERVGYFS